jgi:dienelactone hydrolase
MSDPRPPFDLPDLRAPAEYSIRNPRPVRWADRPVTLSELYFPAQPYLDRPTRAFGYFARPDHLFEPSLPAMLLIHGGGATAEPQWAIDWAARGYAALAIDLYGQGPDREKLPDGGPDWSDNFASFHLTHGLHNTWMYHGIANCIRAITALATLPDVDPNRLGVTGVSWGGFFCAAVMSLDDRIKAGIPVFCAGYNPRIAHASYIPEADAETLRARLDPSNFFPNCRASVLWHSTATDRGTTFDEIMKSHRAVSPHTDSRLSVHGGPGHTDPRCIGVGEQPTPYLFADSIFRDDPPLARLDPPQIDGNHLVLTYRCDLPLMIAALHWTTDLEKPWTDRAWHATVADFSTPGRVTAELPTARPLQTFVTTIDSRGALVSSEPINLD